MPVSAVEKFKLRPLPVAEPFRNRFELILVNPPAGGNPPGPAQAPIPVWKDVRPRGNSLQTGKNTGEFLYSEALKYRAILHMALITLDLFA